MPEQTELHVGSQDGYDWLVSTDTLGDLLRVCPNVVLGKYVAVASFDSGPLVLNDEERASGWHAKNGIAYSPRIERIEMLPRDQYDEWYVFPNQVEFGELVPADRNIFQSVMEKGQVHVFINFGGFQFHLPDYRRDIGELFWQQIGWIKPESYLGDGDWLNFVTSRKDLFAAVRQGLSGLQSR